MWQILISVIFAKKKLLTNWKEILVNVPADLTLYTASIYAETSKGLYVRSLSQDISKKLGLIGFVTKLVRTKNGIFSKKNCVSADKFML